jgi:hypothetical protein
MLILINYNQGFASSIPTLSNDSVEYHEGYVGCLKYNVVAPVVHEIQLFKPLYITSYHGETYNESATFSVQKDRKRGIPPIIFSMAKDVAEPVQDYMEYESDNYTETPPFVYADASAMLISFMIRQATDNKFDMLLLTDHEVYTETVLVNGIEIGVRPAKVVGFRVNMRDNETDNIYGMELGLFPSEDTEIRLARNTEESTQLELSMKF